MTPEPNIFSLSNKYLCVRCVRCAGIRYHFDAYKDFACELIALSVSLQLLHTAQTIQLIPQRKNLSFCIANSIAGS